MANFTPPFARDGERRFPVSDERRDGMECGPADRELFNGLFHRIEAEIGEVINYAGIDQTDEDLTQLRKAIVKIVLASLPVQEDEPEIDITQFVLLSQARARIPIFPEIDTIDGRINVVQSAPGVVRLPGGVTFLHRGIFPITTEQTDFPTTANRIYHLRWSKTEGFTLKDLSDVASYNPGNLIETHTFFDTTYDNMLIARVITNSSNIATITNLANKAVLTGEYYAEHSFESINPYQTTRPVLAAPMVINWGRRPQISLGETGCSGLEVFVAGAVDFGVTGNANNFQRNVTDRYNHRTALQAMNNGNVRGVITAQWQIVARA